MSEAPALLPFRPRLFTVEEYYRMAGAGILQPDEPTELIAGQVIIVPPQGPKHAGTLRKAIKYLRAMLPSEAADISSGELPLDLGEFDEPVPDISVVRPDPTGQDYFGRHPQPGDVLLVIEVAVSSLEFDRTAKSLLYEQAGIPKYWVLDVNREQVHRFTQPGTQGYTSEAVLSRQDTLTPLAFPEVHLSVAECFVTEQG